MKTIYKSCYFLVLLLPFSILAQNTLNGTVLDKSSGQPIPGVNVNVLGSTNGVSTDFDGFQLPNAKKSGKIVFSFIGYKKFINYDGQKSVTVSLEEDANLLNEVVIQVGYGTVKKKRCGAVSQISSKDFNKGQNVTPESLISGRIAGNVTGGSPGAKADIRIRGGSSLNASNEPLIVLDGLPLSNTTPSGATSILSTIDPNDIESLQF
jgi:iron complex outermembrane receptor protein